MKQKTLSVSPRSELGRCPVRRLRKAKQIPAILYGGEAGPRPITLIEKEFRMLMRSISGAAAIIQLEGLGTESILSVIKCIERNRRTDNFDHVDFQEVSATKPMQTQIPVHLKGEAYGVKSENGLIDWVSHQVAISCLPKDLPEYIEVDISNLRIHHSIHIKDLPALAGITFNAHPDQVVVACIEQQVAEEAPKPAAAPTPTAAPAKTPAKAPAKAKK